MVSQGIDIGRAHPPYASWARITIGSPEEKHTAVDAEATCFLLRVYPAGALLVLRVSGKLS
jgi:hypothetical protein